MTKTNFIQCIAFFCSCILTINDSNAQTKLWGVGAAVGQAEAEFQNNFVQATTAGAYSPTQWTALSIHENSGSVTPGNAFWTRSTTGLSQGGYAGSMSVANSPSQANGLAIFDSNFLDDGGTAGAGGTGTSPAHHKGELISPRINLTGATDSAIIVRFYSYNRLKSSADLSISISVDDGVSWAATIDVKTIQPAASSASIQGEVSAMFPSVTTGVANLSQCRIKYTFDGRYYYAMIDDISIEMAPEYDLAIGLPNRNGSTYFKTGDMIRVGGNYYNPLMNLDPNNLGDWSWGAKVINKGWKTIVPADAPRIKCSIDFMDASTGAVTTGVYLDTIMGGATDSIIGNDKDGIALVDYLRDIDFIMNNGAGRYTVTYWVEHDQTDASAQNDSVQHTFVITDDVGGTQSHYLSKARLSSSDGRVYARSSIFPGSAPHTAFEYGSVFYFPRGATDSIRIDSVDFRYYVPSNFSGNATQTLYANVYHYVDGSNGGAANGALVGDELTQVGVASITLNGLGTTLGKGSYHLATFTNFVDASAGTAMQPLTDGGFYYISILNQPSLAGGVNTFEYNDVVIHGVDRLNYAMNIGTRSSSFPIAPCSMRRIDATGVEHWFSGFTGFDEVPAIGVFLSKKSINSSTVALQEEATNLQLYPNPASSQLTIRVEVKETSDVQYIMTDVSGRVVYWNKSSVVEGEEHLVDVSTLSSGIYFVSVETSEGVSTKRFIKK